MTLKVYKNDEYIGTFEGKKETAKKLNIDAKTIYNALHKNMKNRDGYTFEIVKGGDADAKIE